MFGRLLSKGLKNVAIDSNKSHIYIKDTNFALVIMRPYDLVQLSDLVGSGSEDILIWTGKTIGKSLVENLKSNKSFKTRKKLLEEFLKTLTNLGYGKFRMDYREGFEEKTALIEVYNSLVTEIKEKEDAQLICNLYNGIFMGAFTTTGLSVDEVEEAKCPENPEEPMVFKYKLGTEEEI